MSDSWRGIGTYAKINNTRMFGSLSNFFRLISRIAMPRIVVVGLDIQDRHVFMVAIERRVEGDVSVVASGTAELPEATIDDGELKDTESLKSALKKLVALVPSGSWKNATEPIFVFSAPPQHLFTETIVLPRLSEEELLQAIHLRLTTSLPWPQEQAYIDWKISGTNDPDQTSVFIASVSKSVLDPYFKVFLEEGWRVGASEFHLLSLARFIGTDYARSFIFILMDEDGIEFAVCAFGNILGHYLHKLEKKETENHHEILENKVRQLASYAEGNYNIHIERIFIFDKRSWEAQAGDLKTITGIPTELFTPSIKLDARLAVAYGAALRPYSVSESLVNLIPDELGGRYQENLLLKTLGFWTKIGLVFMSIFTVATLSTLLFLKYQERALVTDNQVSSDKLSQMQTQYASLIQDADTFNALANAVLTVGSSRTQVGSRLKLIARYAKDARVAIHSIQLTGGNSIMLNAVAPTRDAAIAFQKALQDSMVFTAVEIPLTQLVKETELTFTVTLR